MSENMCAMCDKPTPGDRGMLCPRHRAEDRAIHARLVDDVDPASREPKEQPL